ncbi:MAG: hypothetical protein HY526_05035 [Betaproteobacteria bacterium]|nr:hypothetical protein [Betaproteobacteria bacterium]
MRRIPGDGHSVTPQLIRDHGRQLARLDVAGHRAGELAAEVDRLNNAVLDGATRLDFNDEPARFTETLLALRETKSR